jgi:hypothetical protein
MTEKRLDVQIEVLSILADGRALKAVGFSLPDSRLAGLALISTTVCVRQPCIGLLFRREGLRAPPLLTVGPRCKIVGYPGDALTVLVCQMPFVLLPLLALSEGVKGPASESRAVCRPAVLSEACAS